jgi:SRSO17 transposase
MAIELNVLAAKRLDAYLELIGSRHLRDRRKRASFGIYTYGLLSESERKSVEPIAALACGNPEDTKRMHDKLLHFVGRSQWDDRAVRQEATRYAVQALSKQEQITTWIVDDTGFLKQGTHSVGVQRQYTGSAGKVTNCQVGVSLAIATETEQLPIDFELYLPDRWANDPARRAEARIPDDVQFATKIELALGMIDRAAAAKVPGNIILADSFYGESSEFRETVRLLGFDIAVGIRSGTKVRRIGRTGRLGVPMSVAKVAGDVPRRKRRKAAWREGTKGTLWSRFHVCRVKTVHDDGTPIEDRDPLWLVIEWPPEGEGRVKFYLTTLPQRMSHKAIVRIIKERWRTERMYEDLKGELGLDHFEGRSFPGWHHHVSVALCCYAFIVAEKVRSFPPSAGGKTCNHTLSVAA